MSLRVRRGFMVVDGLQCSIQSFMESFPIVFRISMALTAVTILFIVDRVIHFLPLLSNYHIQAPSWLCISMERVVELPVVELLINLMSDRFSMTSSLSPSTVLDFHFVDGFIDIT